MNEVIHESLAAAKAACEAYVKIMQNHLELLGVWEENEDSCAATYIYARYRDEAGQVKTYCLAP